MDELENILKNFVLQSATNDLSCSKYPKNHGDFKIRVSFGKGKKAKIPWLAFLKDREKIRCGIYPLVLYLIPQELILITFGISEDFYSKKSWKLDKDYPTVGKILDVLNIKKSKYLESYVYSYYRYNFDYELLKKDIIKVLEIYNNQSTN